MKPRILGYLLLFGSGAAGLAHQIIWTRRLVDVLGASPDTFANVIGAFFVGLALGSALSAWRPVRAKHAWRRVTQAEVAVALLALPLLFAVGLVDEVRGQLPVGVLKILLPLLLVLPPAYAMGLVLPAVVTALRGRAQPLSLYLVNTTGGIFGIGLIVLLALPALGLRAAALLACGVNLLVAALAWWLNRADHDFVAPPEDAAEARAAEAALPFARTLAFGSGFLVLALEVVLQHQCAQVTINSYFSGATVLVFVLLALVAAAAVAGWLAQRFGDVRRVLGWTLLATVVLGVSQPWVFLWLRPGLRYFAYTLTPAGYFLRVSALALAVIVPVCFAAGCTFPLLLRSLPENRAGGRQLAWLLAVNGLGGWLGAEFMQRRLLPATGLWVALPVLAAVALLLWALNGLRLDRDLPWRLSGLLVGTAVLITGAGFARQLPQLSADAGDEIAAVRVAREGVVAVAHHGADHWRIIFNNNYSLGGSRAQFNQERQAHLPLLLHGRPKSVALLGVATGSTTAGAALHPGVERIEAAELSGLVLDFAREYFAPFNRDVFHDPRVRIHHEDARAVMMGHAGDYDVIIGDLFLPWHTGEGRLFTAEHFAGVHRALRPDGLFCQWLPLFQLTRPQFDTILRTFRAEFPDVFLVRGDFYTETPIVGLVGGRALSAVNWDRVEDACARLRTDGKVTDPLVRHAAGVAMTIIGPAPASPPGPVNTLANGWLEWDAGQNVVGLRQPWFMGIPCAEYVRDATRAGASALPPSLRAAQDAGQFFLTLEIAAKLNLPAAASLRAQMSDRLPQALLDDFTADWRQWPMRVKPFVATGNHTPPSKP
jgi:spermidine synthase